jgi:hypothetical protein
MARASRRRQADEALASERERATALQEEIERLIVELEGPRIDEAAFARMAPEDAAVVRELIGEEELPPDEAWAVDGDDDEEAPVEPPDTREETEEEIARLQGEIAESRRRQEALERYLEALG